MGQPYRLIKWIGLPAVVKEDGWTIHDWEYENNRAVPIKLYGRGATNRIIEAGKYRYYPTGEIVEIKHTYVWREGKGEGDWVVPVQIDDAFAILKFNPWEFKDVTGVADYSKVRHPGPIIAGSVPRYGISRRTPLKSVNKLETTFVP